MADAALVGAADASAPVVDAGPIDAGPPLPAELSLVVTATNLDGGFEVVGRDVDPVKALQIFIPVALQDYRLRVFDDSDKVVPSDDLVHEADGGIDYQVSFTEPLKTGRTYRLTVESQTGDALDGFKDAELTFKVRGEVVKEPKKTAPGGKKKKR